MQQSSRQKFATEVLDSDLQLTAFNAAKLSLFLTHSYKHIQPFLQLIKKVHSVKLEAV